MGQGARREFGGDPEFVVITGGSAGGHLSSLAALTANDPQFQPEFEEADTRVQAAVPFYGVYDFTRTDGALHPGQPVVYAELPLAQHAFDILGSARASHAAVAVEQFLAEVYTSRQSNAQMT